MAEQRQKPALLRVLRNSPRAMRLLGFTNLVESAWLFSFFAVRSCPARHHEPITVKSWLKKLSLSVNRWGFTDKLFKINNLSVWRRVFTDEIHSVRKRLTGIAEVLTKKCGALRGMRQTQNWIESNNLHIVIRCILLSINKIRWMAKCRLCEKVGNLAFALSTNWLWINAFVCWANFRLFGFSLWTCLSEAIVSGNNLQLCLTEVVMPLQQEASVRTRPSCFAGASL